MNRDSNQNNHNQDPFMVASILNSFMTDRNPIQVLVGDIGHMLKVVANLGRNRKMAQLRIEQLQDQITRVEGSMKAYTPKSTGSRLDKLR